MPNPAPARKKAAGFILFERAFRPFFPGAALFAAIAIPLWIFTLETDLETLSGFSARDYHVHEMIFGYLGAVLAGFLFTAMPNWTGRPALAGTRLALVSALWLTGRLAVYTSASWPTAAAVIDASFLLTVSSLAWKDVIAGGSIRNMPVCLLVSLLAIANIAYDFSLLQSADTGWAERSALAIIATLISFIGGRVVPNFSGNWMKKNNISPLPSPFSTFDKAVLATTVVTLTSWILTPETSITGSLFSVTFFAHALRLLRWRGWQTTTEPLVLILHIGYLWLVLWFGLTGMAILSPAIFSISSALHALTAGAIGTMTMAIMTRAILGHSGRKLSAGRITRIIYALITAGAFVRVFAQSFTLDFMLATAISGTLWSAGFLLFAFTYGPYCLSPKNPSQQ